MARAKKETIEPSEVKDNFDAVGEISEDINVEYRDYIPTEECIPTGLTLLNLALSGNPYGGVSLNLPIVHISGESSAGKTTMAIEMMAQGCMSEHLNDYEMLYMDSEHGNNFNIFKRYGDKVAKRIKLWKPSSEENTIDKVFYRLAKKLDEGKKFIVVLDSLDSIITEAQKEVYKTNIENSLKDKKLDEEARAMFARKMSQHLSNITSKLAENKCGMIIVSQLRDTMDMYKPVGTSGGKSLAFYRSYWFTIRGSKPIKAADYKGQEQIVGTECSICADKNRGSGIIKYTVHYDLYTNSGIKDNKSMVDFLVTYSEIETAVGWYRAEWLYPHPDGKSFRLIELLKIIKNNPEVRVKLINKTKEVWNKIRESVKEDF